MFAYVRLGQLPRKTKVLSLLVVVMLLLSLLLQQVAYAGASTYSDSWQSWVYKPGATGGWRLYQGDYHGGSWWANAFPNFQFTCHESRVYIHNPTGDVTGQWTEYDFYYGGTRMWVHASWGVDCRGYIYPGGWLGFGGNTHQKNWAYHGSQNGRAASRWAFRLCTSTGCYGGANRNYPQWGLWG